MYWAPQAHVSQLHGLLKRYGLEERGLAAAAGVLTGAQVTELAADPAVRAITLAGKVDAAGA